MRPLYTLLLLAIATCNAHPGDDFGEYIYPSHIPYHHGDDFAHRFQYKEYFPTPHEVGVGSGYLGGKLYAGSHAHRSIGDHIGNKIHYISSGIGDHLSTKAHALNSAHSAVSDHIGGKISYLTSGISNHFQGHYPCVGCHGDKYYAGGYGYYGYDGHNKFGAIAHGVGEALSGPIATIKHVHAGISDTISHKAQAVKEGLGEQLNNAAHTIKVAQSDISDHLGRSAVHLKKGISGHLSDTGHTAKSLYGILSDYLSKKVQVIKEGVTHQLSNTGHALSAANAVLLRHLSNKAVRVGEFLQGKAHEVSVSLDKKLHRDKYDHVPHKVDHDFAIDGGKFEGFGGHYPGGASFADSGIVAYNHHQPAQLFEAAKVVAAPVAHEAHVPIVSSVPISLASTYDKI